MFDLTLLFLRFFGFAVILACLVGWAVALWQMQRAEFRYQRADAWRLIVASLIGAAQGGFLMWGSFVCAA